MHSVNRSKINHLLHKWPVGAVAVTPWLARQGVYQQLAYEYERSGWLKKLGHGAYLRSGDMVEWSGGVYALQHQLGLPVHVGGKSALELRGFEHFVPAGKGSNVYLFGASGRKLPSWFVQHDWRRRVIFKTPRLFTGNSDVGLTIQSFGRFDVRISAPERAMLEVLHFVPMEQSAEESQLLMEGLGTLRPKLVQDLLERCRSVKVKRLFLAMANRSNHAWLKRVSLKKVKLGRGKRQVVRNGILDPKFQVTLPRMEIPSSTSEAK